MFYLKYRPQTIEEIDNQQVRERLRMILVSKSIPHALLFTGPKGGGKTSAARIFTKAINCENNTFAKKTPSVEPCNQCRSCRLITLGNSVDVVEIDAASARKIDDIRDLIAKVKFLPIYNRYKVYIVDEVHMLTYEAFNAFLKTLEEPPSATIFILATTEPDELPATITSRCIRCHFRKAAVDEIIRMLKRIAAKEKLVVPEQVAATIARQADYSFRDGAKILEQAVTQVSGDKKKTITVGTIETIVGLGKENRDLLRLLESRDYRNSLALVEKFDEQGGDHRKLIEAILDKLHALLLKKNQIEVDLSESYNFSLAEITLLIKLFQEAYTILKYSPIEILPVEVAITDFFAKIGKAGGEFDV